VFACESIQSFSDFDNSSARRALNRHLDHRDKVRALAFRDWTTNVPIGSVRGYEFRTFAVEDCDPRNSAGTRATQLLSDFIAVLHLLHINFQDKIVISKQIDIGIEELLELLTPTSPRCTEVHHDAFVGRFGFLKS
jgi:hypothetical protein